MNVSLTPVLETYVEDKVKSGTFSSASEVVRAGRRLLQEHDAAHAARLEGLRADVQLGSEQLRRGQTKQGSEVFVRVLARHQPTSAS